MARCSATPPTPRPSRTRWPTSSRTSPSSAACSSTTSTALAATRSTPSRGPPSESRQARLTPPAARGRLGRPDLDGRAESLSGSAQLEHAEAGGAVEVRRVGEGRRPAAQLRRAAARALDAVEVGAPTAGWLAGSRPAPGGNRRLGGLPLGAGQRRPGDGELRPPVLDWPRLRLSPVAAPRLGGSGRTRLPFQAAALPGGVGHEVGPPPGRVLDAGGEQHAQRAHPELPVTPRIAHAGRQEHLDGLL